MQADQGSGASQGGAKFPKAKKDAAQSFQYQGGNSPTQHMLSKVAEQLRGNDTGLSNRRPHLLSGCFHSLLALKRLGILCPHYLRPEALTLQKQRPFHHSPVHVPGRFLRRFLARRAQGWRRGWGGAGPAGGVPAPTPCPGSDSQNGGRGREHRGGRVTVPRYSGRLNASRPLPTALGKLRGFSLQSPGAWTLGLRLTSYTQYDIREKVVTSPAGSLGHPKGPSRPSEFKSPGRTRP